MRKAPAGFTLVELLVGMALLLLLLTVTFALFFPQLRLSNVTHQVADTQQDALKAQFDITQALTESNAQMLLNETSSLYYPGAGLPGPAIAFPISYNNTNFYYATPTTPPAPNPAPTDPFTGATIPESVAAWNAVLVYFVDAAHNLWKVTVPACGCNGFSACGVPYPSSALSCGSLAYPSYPGFPPGSPDPDTGLYYPRISAAAISTYATKNPPAGATAKLLVPDVLALEIFSGGKKPQIEQPLYNPFEVILLVKRSYAGYSTPNVNLPQPMAGVNSGTIRNGDTIMTLDTSVSTSVGATY